MKRGLFNGFVTSSLLNHYFVVNDTKPNVTRTRYTCKNEYDFYTKMLTTITNSCVIIL